MPARERKGWITHDVIRVPRAARSDGAIASPVRSAHGCQGPRGPARARVITTESTTSSKACRSSRSAISDDDGMARGYITRDLPPSLLILQGISLPPFYILQGISLPPFQYYIGSRVRVRVSTVNAVCKPLVLLEAPARLIAVSYSF